MVQVIHRRMGEIVGTKHLFGLVRLVGHPFVGDRQDRQDHAFLGAQALDQNLVAGVIGPIGAKIANTQWSGLC